MPGDSIAMSEPSLSASRPASEYRLRLEARQAEARIQDRRHLAVGYARLGVAAAGIAMAWLVFDPGLFSGWWLILPTAVFMVLVKIHVRVEEARDRAGKAAAFYQRGLDRLEFRWMGRGDRGERFLAGDHPYAADLDLFGEGSLFELLCTARTGAGAERLASWIKSPASPEEIRARHEAVEELRDRLDLREDLALLGEEVNTAVDPAMLLRWSGSPRLLSPGLLRSAVLVFTGAAVAGIVAWLAGVLDPRVLLILLGCEAALAAVGRRRVQQVTAAVERPGSELEVLAHALERIEAERFRSPRLAKLRSALDTGGTPTSKRVHALGRLVRRLDWRRNLIFAPIAALVMWTTHLAYALEAWRAAAAPLMPLWLDVVGEIEALCALAGYAYEHPADPFPEIVPGPLVYEGEALGHPLISESACVRNDVNLGDGVRLLVVSGSNMSGKTTLLRTVGINVVLALAGCPVRAARLRLSPVEVGACIRVQDSIQEGRSRFYAEILRLKQIVAMTEGAAPVLFLLDEILHGTNSHDRRIGAEGLVKGLLARQAAGLITTHDLALAEIARGLGPVASNVHFEDHLEGGRMAFDFLIRPGVVEKSNAIELMRAVGLDV